MNITLDYLRGRRIWVVPNFVVWGDWSLYTFFLLYTEMQTSAKRVVFSKSTLGGLDQTVEFSNLFDFKGNQLPDTINNPKQGGGSSQKRRPLFRGGNGDHNGFQNREAVIFFEDRSGGSDDYGNGMRTLHIPMFSKNAGLRYLDPNHESYGERTPSSNQDCKKEISGLNIQFIYEEKNQEAKHKESHAQRTEFGLKDFQENIELSPNWQTPLQGGI